MFPLIPLIFGTGFRAAVIPGVVILWAVVPNVLFFWRRPLSLSLGLAGRLLRYRAVASALQLTLTLLLIRPLGTLGAALSMLVMQWFYAGLELRLIVSWRRKLLEGGTTS
jgi:O-antigen/teichoic acid export membrane protein